MGVSGRSHVLRQHQPRDHRLPGGRDPRQGAGDGRVEPERLHDHAVEDGERLQGLEREPGVAGARCEDLVAQLLLPGGVAAEPVQRVGHGVARGVGGGEGHVGELVADLCVGERRRARVGVAEDEFGEERAPVGDAAVEGDVFGYGVGAVLAMVSACHVRAGRRGGVEMLTW